MRNKILMTLALLLTAVTGAWADEAKVYTEAVVFNSLKAGDVLTDGFSITKNIGDYIKVKGYKKDSGTAETEEYSDLLNDCTYPGGIVITVSGYGISGNYTPYADGKDANAWIVSKKEVNGSYTALYLDGYNYLPAGSPLTVEWDPATKTGNFVMPAFDVEIAPIYAPVAQWAKVENADQLPTAIEGIYAESTDAIVKAGTVAKIGETENPQGTVMYAVTSTNQATAPALDAFSADVPTAENIPVGSEVLVWYYIKGADTPEGEDATAENTFNDSEICTEPITVTVLSNKFDIQFKAANDNTIEAGKATVKVGDAAAEVKEGKLTGVKMGSKVTITAKDGYKFRKAEAKKKSAAAPTTTVTWNSSNVFNSAHENVELAKWSPTPLSYEGITISFSGTKASSFQAYDEDDHIGSLTCYGNYDDSFTFTAPSGKKFCKIEIINNGSIVFTNYGDWTSDASNKIVWSGTAATAVTLGSVYTDADDLNSIVFYLSE